MTILEAVTTVKVPVRTRDQLKAGAAGRFRTLGEYIDFLVEQDARSTRLAILAEQMRNTPDAVMAEYRRETQVWEHAELQDLQ